jgi:hypothetical protein
MPDLTETDIEFTDFANPLTTGRLEITYPFDHQRHQIALPRSSACGTTKRPGIQGIAGFCAATGRVASWRLAKVVSR